MRDDYYLRLLPYILNFSREFMLLKGFDNTAATLILDSIFKRFTGVSALDNFAAHLKGGDYGA